MLALTPFAVLMLALTPFAASADGSLALARRRPAKSGEGSASDEPHVEPSEPQASERDSNYREREPRRAVRCSTKSTST
jgi:hypothetical protein